MIVSESNHAHHWWQLWYGSIHMLWDSDVEAMQACHTQRANPNVSSQNNQKTLDEHEKWMSLPSQMIKNIVHVIRMFCDQTLGFARCDTNTDWTNTMINDGMTQVIICNKRNQWLNRMRPSTAFSSNVQKPSWMRSRYQEDYEWYETVYTTNPHSVPSRYCAKTI